MKIEQSWRITSTFELVENSGAIHETRKIGRLASFQKENTLPELG